jgi:hypothetical protein
MSQIENSKRAILQAVHFRDLGIWIADGLRKVKQKIVDSDVRLQYC